MSCARAHGRRFPRKGRCVEWGMYTVPNRHIRCWTHDDGGPMKDYPIKLGSILFTMVEPHKGHEVDYNRWYERDHFYAGCMVGPGILAGKRWVAPKPYKDLRYPPESPITGPAGRGS